MCIPIFGRGVKTIFWGWFRRHDEDCVLTLLWLIQFHQPGVLRWLTFKLCNAVIILMHEPPVMFSNTNVFDKIVCGNLNISYADQYGQQKQLLLFFLLSLLTNKALWLVISISLQTVPGTFHYSLHIIPTLRVFR